MNMNTNTMIDNDMVFLRSMMDTRGYPACPSSFTSVSFSDVPSHGGVFFLGDAGGARDLFLWLPGDEKESNDSWRGVVAFESNQATDKPMSKEEELLRERMRMRSRGVTSYSYAPNHRRLLIPQGTSLFTCVVPEQANGTAWPLALTKVGDNMFDCKLSPDGRRVAFIRDADIWVAALDGDKAEQRLTFAKPQGLSAGVAEYIIQEEFDRYTGYWWNPNPSNTAESEVLYLQVDERAVPKVTIAGDDDYFFPRPGEANATCELRSVTWDTVEAVGALAVRDQGRTMPLHQEFDWAEYVPCVYWGSTSGEFYVVLTNRRQNRTEFIRFQGIVDPAPVSVFQETSKHWVNATKIFHAFTDNRGILVASEESGFRHLVFVPRDTSQPQRAITAGEWVVYGDDNCCWVDEEANCVYFRANKDTPLEAHLYATSLLFEEGDVKMASNPITRLTTAGFDHSNVLVSVKQQLFVTVFSNVSTAPQCQLFSLLPSGGAEQFGTVPLAKDYPRPVFSCTIPEIFEFQADPDALTLFGCVFRPPPGTPSQDGRYPTLVYTYGGPHVQLVRNSFSLTANTRLQMYAALGYAVAIVDSRGSYNRGIEFEAQLSEKMGQVEISDQVALVRHLTDTIKCTQADRVAITGWSYGGYMTLLALSQRPDVFKVGVSGAPVTRWELYDTGYTERYMDTPQNNPDGYAKGSVLHYVDGFPRTHGRLLICHGLIDENVHFEHTCQLVKEFVNRDIPYDIKIFPGERHGIRSARGNFYFEKETMHYLRTNL